MSSKEEKEKKKQVKKKQSILLTVICDLNCFELENNLWAVSKVYL